MKEICLIGSTVWSLREVGNKLPLCREGGAISYKFYDPRTGEVWGSRMYFGCDSNSWIYIPRRKESMDLSFPYEWTPEYSLPPLGVLCALIVAGAVKAGSMC